MTVAASQEITAGKGAELIRTKTGRRCTRQNLEKLCKQGKLPRSCVSQGPVRVLADLLVDEYLDNIDERQSVRAKPGVRRELSGDEVTPRRPPPSSEPPADDELPAYTASQQRKAFEQANLLELERRQKEGRLVYKADVEQAQMAVALTLKNQLEALPKQIKQQLPHLTIGDEEMIERLVAKVLTAVADWRMDQEDDE